MSTVVYRVLTPCALMRYRRFLSSPEYGGSMFLLNPGIYLQAATHGLTARKTNINRGFLVVTLVV
jgi:hypothetical protein